MKRLLLILGAVLLVVGGLMAPAFAQEGGVVGVTVEVAQPSVTVTPDTVSYGLVNLNVTGLVPVDPPDPRIQATNSGTCFVDLRIKGAGTTNWTLSSSPGPEIYVHYFGTGPPGEEVYFPLSTGYQDLGPFASYAPGDSYSFKLMMDTPTESIHFGVQDTTVTVMAVMVTEGITLTLATDAPYTQGKGPAHLTVTIKDQDMNPVSGIISENFRTHIYGFTGLQPVTFTETAPGVYEGDLDISWIVPESYPAFYTVRVWTWDAAMRRGFGEATFEITLP